MILTASTFNAEPPDRTVKELVGTVASVLWSKPYESIVARLTSGYVVCGPIEDMTLEFRTPYRFLGRWETHAKHGDRFNFTTYVADTPATRPGVVKYLCDVAPNVGRARAERLWDVFGTDAVATLRENPKAVADANIMPIEQADEAAQALAANAKLERTKIDLFSIFAGRGFPGRIINACIREWGAKAAQTVRQNPFALLASDMPGAGFKRCDRMFIDFGGKPDRLKRQMLSAWSALREDSTGHTWFRSGYAEEAVKKRCTGANVDPIAALVMGKRGGWISTRRDPSIRERVWVAEAEKATKELDLATSVLRLQKWTEAKGGLILWPIEFPAGLSEHQTEKLGEALVRPVAILAGTPGCLSGDTTIRVNRGGKGFAIPISRLVARWNGTQLFPGRKWDRSIPTMVARANNGCVRLCQLRDAWESGIKETFELVTNGGRIVRATEDHPFLTDSGEFVRLGDLRQGDCLQVDAGRSLQGRRKKDYRDRNTMFHPHQRRGRCGRFRHPEHRLTVEAEMNGLSLEDFLWVLRNDPVQSAMFKFLKPYTVIHHKNREHTDNAATNLAVLATQSVHAAEHAPETTANVLSRIGIDRVKSIVRFGEESTYDIEVEDDPHCFIANGFVVHNTGKTYTAAAIIRKLADTYGIANVAVAAPTGKAAVRCTASMRRYALDIEASTIHRLLGIGRNGHDGKGWGFTYNAHNPVTYRFVVVDESSMLDTSLAADLFAACADGTHVLLIGDPYQLPPVGHGAPLRDMLASGAVPFGELSEIRRNSGMIVEACAAIKSGKTFAACAGSCGTRRSDWEATPLFLGESDAEQNNLEQIEAKDAKSSVEYLLALLDQAGPGVDRVWDVQVIVAVNDKGEVSRTALNELLQRQLNPNGKEIKPNPFRVADKIICLRNGWVNLATPPNASENAEDATTWTSPAPGTAQSEAYVANGEIGAVLAVAPKLTIARFFGPDRIVRIPMGKQKDDAEGDAAAAASGRESGRGCDYDLAYAITGHKSQGSEWPTVIVMVDDQAGFVASREWIYTAISRAAKRCYLIGKKTTVEKFCRRKALEARKTFLKELLSGEAK